MGANSQSGGFLNLGQLLGPRLAVLLEMLYQFKCEFRVAIPGVVVSVNSNQTVNVQPAVQENMLQNANVTQVNLPVLSDVVLGAYRGGGFSVTLPIKAGDEGLLVFADMCIDAWWQQGAPSSGPMPNQVERRRHDLSDGFFLPVGWSQPRVLGNYSTSALEIRSDDGDVAISVESDEIVMTPDGGTTMVMVQAGQLTLTGTTVTVNGNLQVNGNISNTGTLDGKTFLTHQHTGVSTGSGDTGPVL
jgi:Phage protein Gp138 N-terminal domain